MISICWLEFFFDGGGYDSPKLRSDIVVLFSTGQKPSLAIPM